MDALGQAASDYRNHVYQSGFWGKKRTVSMEGLKFHSSKFRFYRAFHQRKSERRSVVSCL
jgi:hypothetical protein